MRKFSWMLVSSLLFIATAAFPQEVIQPGTVIPVRLNSSFSLKTSSGHVLTARVMQDVPLSAGTIIRAGAKVIGHVLSVTPPGNGTDARVSFVFDKLVLPKRTVPLSVNLRAMASFMEVDEAQIPETGPDRGTPENAWTTVLVGGDIDYRGGGPVMEGSSVVGKPTFDGVLSQVVSNSGADCRATVGGNDRPQALWVFSADACGLYGFPGVSIAHAGRTDPAGVIVLTSAGKDLRISGGSGMLLRVTGGTAKSA